MSNKVTIKLKVLSVSRQNEGRLKNKIAYLFYKS